MIGPRLIPGLPLFADEDGSIWRPTQDGLIPMLTERRPSGYVTVRHRGRHYYVHRLVCAAFHGPPPTPAHEAHHDNGVRNHNSPDNLAWLTKAENLARRAFRNKRGRPEPTEPTHPRLLELWRQRHDD